MPIGEERDVAARANRSVFLENLEPRLLLAGDLDIARHLPQSTHTNADEVTFRVRFADEVRNVTAEDFSLTGTAADGGTIATPRQISPSVYDISVKELTESNGTIDLDLAIGNDIETLAGSRLGDSPSIINEETYTIDNRVPRVLSVLRQYPSVEQSKGSRTQIEQRVRNRTTSPRTFFTSFGKLYPVIFSADAE